MSVVSASVARQSLPAQLDRVAAGEQVAITRHGHVVAYLVPPEAVRSERTREAWEAADALDARLSQAKNEPLANAQGMSPERAEELVAEIYADRAAR